MYIQQKKTVWVKTLVSILVIEVCPPISTLICGNNRAHCRNNYYLQNTVLLNIMVSYGEWTGFE